MDDPTFDPKHELAHAVAPVVASEASEDVPAPVTLGAELDASLKLELHRILLDSTGQLGQVYRAMLERPTAGPTELLPLTNCANAGVVGNRRVIVNAVMDGVEPSSPSVARQAARTVGTLLKEASSEQATAHLARVRSMLEEIATDERAVEEEEQRLQSDSEALAATITTASGVYVFTYPQYWKFASEPDTDRRLLKVGRTTNHAWSRVLSQARQTGMPEDPMLLRVYEAEDPQATERAFHMLLDAAQHRRSAGKAVGREWFSSTLDFCDAIASVLGLTVHKGIADV